LQKRRLDYNRTGDKEDRVSALKDPGVKVLVAEVRKLNMDENAAQTRSQKAAVKSKLRELNTILKKKGGQDLEKNS